MAKKPMSKGVSKAELAKAIKMEQRRDEKEDAMKYMPKRKSGGRVGKK